MKPVALSVEQYLRALAPQCIADGGYDVFINMAEQRTNRQFYGLKANQAVALLAAHIWFLLGSGNGGECRRRGYWFYFLQAGRGLGDWVRLRGCLRVQFPV